MNELDKIRLQKKQVAVFNRSRATGLAKALRMNQLAMSNYLSEQERLSDRRLVPQKKQCERH